MEGFLFGLLVEALLSLTFLGGAASSRTWFDLRFVGFLSGAVVLRLAWSRIFLSILVCSL